MRKRFTIHKTIGSLDGRKMLIYHTLHNLYNLWNWICSQVHRLCLYLQLKGARNQLLTTFLVSGHFGEGLFELLGDPLQLLLLHHQLVLQPVDLRASVVEQRVVGHLHMVMMMKMMMMMVTSICSF